MGSSAVHRPKHILYPDPDTTLSHLAAELAESMAMNHPFCDGNKQTAYWTMARFLHLNGAVFKEHEAHEEASVIITKLVVREIDAAQLARFVTSRCEV